MYDLVGIDGNAFSILGYTKKAMKQEGFTQADIDTMYSDATSGTYNNLIQVCLDWIDKCNAHCDDD